MSNWMKNLFSNGDPNPSQGADDDVHALMNQNQTLKMEIAERDRQINQLKDRLDAIENQQTAAGLDRTSARIEAIFHEASSAVSQLLTQAYLLENENKPVQAADILQVARRIIRAMERNGLVIEGQPGSTALYNPSYHSPLTTTTHIAEGQSVTIRLAGISYQGKILSKAGVEPAQPDEISGTIPPYLI